MMTIIRKEDLSLLGYHNMPTGKSLHAFRIHYDFLKFRYLFTSLHSVTFSLVSPRMPL